MLRSLHDTELSSDEEMIGQSGHHVYGHVSEGGGGKAQRRKRRGVRMDQVPE